MKASDLLIILIWTFFLVGAYLQGKEMPYTQLFPSPLPLQTVAIILVFPFAFFLPAAFLQRHVVFEVPWLRRLVDAKFGQGSHRIFMIRLKPILLFTLGVALVGTTGLISTHLTTQAQQAYVMSGFFLSGALGLAVAYALSLRFPPRLC